MMSQQVKLPVTLNMPEEAVVVEGLPGVGLVGGIAASYIIHQLGMELSGYVESPHLPPVAMLQQGIARHPFRIYTKDRLVVLYSEVPVAPVHVHELSRRIAEWAHGIGASQVITLAGIPSPMREPAVYGVAADEEAVRYLREHGINVLEEGVVSGMPGQVLLDCAKLGMTAFCLLAQTPGMNPDPAGAAELIKVLNRLHGLEINVEPLLREAKEIEAKMEELAKQTRKMKQQETLPMFY